MLDVERERRLTKRLSVGDSVGDGIVKRATVSAIEHVHQLDAGRDCRLTERLAAVEGMAATDATRSAATALENARERDLLRELGLTRCWSVVDSAGDDMVKRVTESTVAQEMVTANRSAVSAVRRPRSSRRGYGRRSSFLQQAVDEAQAEVRRRTDAAVKSVLERRR